MNNKVRVGDSIIIMTWASKNHCDWSADFGKSFEVIGFAKDFSTYGFKNHWMDISDDYEFIDLSNINSVSKHEIPSFIVDKKLSNGKNIIHPIFVHKDFNNSRINKINNIVDE